MALQIWLPLNGNTLNLGLAGFEPAAADITYASSGKIGAQCYSTGSLTMSAEQSNQVLNNNEISIAFWIKPQNTSNSIIFGNDTNRQFSLFQYSSRGSGYHGTALHWSWTIALGAGENYDANGNYINISNAATIEDALPVGQWTHVCITYNNPIFKAYVNGQLRAVRNGSVNYTFNQSTPIINANGNRHINDFRVYDHCLTTNEVKTLSQGLVAHYKLNYNYNDSIEYDYSGYNNNGSKSSTFNYSDSSPRYNNSMIFENNKYINCGRGSMVTDAITVAGWFYSNNWSNTGKLISCAHSGGWDFWSNGSGQMTMEVYRNNAYITGVYPTTLSSWAAGWHHIVGTYDGYKAEMYVDGVKGITSTITKDRYPITYHTANSLFIGAEAGASSTVPDGVYFTGQASDVRIYATALSAEDIKRLYQTPISLSKNGNLNACEFIEEEDDKAHFEKTGVVQVDSIADQSSTHHMPIKLLSDNSIWGRIHYLDLTRRNDYFKNNDEVQKCVNKYNRYSYMKDIDKFKNKDNNYEFMLTYSDSFAELPTGYKRLYYIESTQNGTTKCGKQYIDTGYKPNNNTRVIMSYWHNTNAGFGALFGSRNATTQQVFGCWIQNDTIFPHYGDRSYITNTNTNIISINTIAQNLYDMNGGLTTVNETISNSKENATFQSNYSLMLLTMHDSSGIDNRRAWGRIYSCQIFETDQLIRNFIPCKNPQGVPGLYDSITKSFYSSAEGTAFIAGREINTSGYNRWKQTNSPNVPAGQGSGYERVGSPSFTTHTYPLTKTVVSNTYPEYAMYSANVGNSWWAPIGQKKPYDIGIPAADGSTQLITELWVRIDNLPLAKKMQIFANAIQSTDFVEW